ncbi:hypothetical protein Tco_0282305 [Tanacetum coccineum]
MSSEEMERVIAQQVANAIEAIAIYESKIRMAHDSMNQVVREEAMVGKNVSNERKWGSDHENMPMSGQGLSAATIEQLITQRVAEAMEAYEAN